MSVLTDLIQDVVTESNVEYWNSDDPTAVALENLVSIDFDIIDTLGEVYAIESAIEVTNEATIDADFDFRAGKAKFKTSVFDTIKEAVKTVFKKVITFFKNLFQNIYIFFHEKVVIRQLKLIRENRDKLDAWMKTDGKGNYEVVMNAIVFNRGSGLEFMISNIDFIKGNFDKIMKLILASVENIEREEASMAQGLGIDKLTKEINKLINDFKTRMVPDLNPDLIGEKELKSSIRNRYFGEKKIKTQQNVKEILTSDKVVDQFIDPNLLREFQTLNRKANQSVSIANRRLTDAIDKLNRSENKKIRYTQIASRFKFYRRLLTLFVTAMSTYWELFLISRNEVISACVRVIKHMMQVTSND